MKIINTLGLNGTRTWIAHHYSGYMKVSPLMAA